MNKILALFLILTSHGIHAQDLEPSSEVVDPMAPISIAEETPEAAPAEAPAEVIKEDITFEAPPVTAPAEGPAAVEPVPAPVQEAAAVTPAPVAAPVPTPVPASTPQSANQVSTHVEVDHDYFVPRKGHWLSSFGFEAMEYELPADFTGEKEKFKDQNRTLYGGRLGFGREFYLGWGFNTTTKLEGFYMGTLFEKANNAGPLEKAEVYAYVKKTGHIWGGEASQSLGYLFDFRTKNPFMDEMTYLTLEPYVFAGLGRARAYNRLSYHYDLITQEDYRVRVQDSITSSSVGAGVNITSRTGYFLYLKATEYRMNITKRNEESFAQANGQATPTRLNNTSTDVDIDPVMIYALGGGYKW